MSSLDDVISAEFTSKPKVAKVVMEIPKNHKKMVLKKKEDSHQGFTELLDALNYEIRTEQPRPIVKTVAQEKSQYFIENDQVKMKTTNGEVVVIEKVLSRRKKAKARRPSHSPNPIKREQKAAMSDIASESTQVDNVS